MKRSEIVFLVCVLAAAGLFAVRSFSAAFGTAGGGYVAVSPSGAAGEPRDVDMDRLLRLLREGRLSDREALFAREVGETPSFTSKRVYDWAEITVVLPESMRGREGKVLRPVGERLRSVGEKEDYAIDRVVEELGSLGALGAWVKVPHPFGKGAPCAELEMMSGAFALGESDEGWTAVVTAPTTIQAAEWAATLCALGSEGLEKLPANAGLEAMLIGGTAEAPEVRITPGFYRFLAWGPEF